MSQDTLESATPTTEQSHGDAHVPSTPRDLSSYPERLTAKHLAQIYEVGVKRIYRLDAEGAFVFAEIRPRIGRKAWSRERIREHINGALRGLTATKLPRKRTA